MRGGRKRAIGTSASPNSRELLIDNHLDDFEGEVFSSGSEPFEEQMFNIRNNSGQSKVVAGKMSANDDCDDDTDEEAEVSKAGNLVLHKNGGSNLEPSPVFKNKRGAAKVADSELCKKLYTEDVTHNLRNLDETEQDGFVEDSLVLDYDEYDEGNEHERDDSYLSEEGASYNQFDAQSLGDGTDDELCDDEGYVPTVNVLSEEQLDEQLNEQRDNGDIA